MRLIDADWLTDTIGAMIGYGAKPTDIWDMVNYDAPTIDLVRCRECKWWNGFTHGCRRSPSVEPWRADDYCSYGERQE